MGGPCPNFLSTFYKLYILGQFEDGETPAQFFWQIGVKKKWYKLSKSGEGGGGRGNLDKIQKNSYFFSGNLPLVTEYQRATWTKLLILAMFHLFNLLSPLVFQFFIKHFKVLNL